MLESRICLPAGFSSLSSLSTLSLTMSPPPPASSNFASSLPWAEICLYDDSPYTAPAYDTYGTTEVLCVCSGWNFSANPLDRTYVNVSAGPYIGETTLVPWLPKLTSLIFGVPHNKSFSSWDLTKVQGNILASVIYPSDWPSPVATLNTNLPNIQTFDMYGPWTSMPSNLFSCDTLIEAFIEGANFSSLPPINTTMLLNSLTIKGLNLPSFPDFTPFWSGLSVLSLSGTVNSLPNFSTPLSLSSLSISLRGLNSLSQSFFNCLVGSSLTIQLDDATEICSTDCSLSNLTTQVDLVLPSIRSSFPPSFFTNSSQLSFLTISGSPSMSWNISLSSYNLSSVTTVRISFMNLGDWQSTFPSGICNAMPKMTALYISNSNLTSLPDFSACPSGTSIFLSSSNLSNLNLTTLTTISFIDSLSISNASIWTLPQSFCDFASINNLILSMNQISSLPDCSTGSNYTLKHLDISDNQLSSWNELQNFLQPSRSGSAINMLSLSMNDLGQDTAEIPLSFIDSLDSLQVLEIANNGISGSFDPSGNWSQLLNRSWNKLDLSNNNFQGTISDSQFSQIQLMNALVLAGNQLSGTIQLTAVCTTNLTLLNVSNNQFTSFSNQSLGNCPMSKLATLDISNNLLSEIPNNVLFQLPHLAVFSMQNNPLQGSPILPNWIFQGQTLVDVSNCSFTGTMPKTLSFSGNPTIWYDLSNNQITGDLPENLWELPYSTTSYTYYIQNNLLNGTIPGYPFGYTLQLYYHSLTSQIDMSNNHLTGTIPSLQLFLSAQKLNLSHNPFLTGSPPLVPAAPLQNGEYSTPVSLDFSFDTGMDMCGNTNLLLLTGATVSCNLDYTTACACASTFPQCVSDNCPPPALPPLGCSGNSPDPSSFTCQNGVWTSTGSYTTSGSVIISGTTYINGNLTTSGVTISIPLSGSSSTLGFGSSGTSPLISASGCFDSNGDIDINLSSNDIDSIDSRSGHTLTLILIGQNSSCPPISTSNLKLVSAKSCKQVTASLSSTSNSPQDLNVVFKVSSFNCDIWWIILCSVLGGLIIISVIVFLIIYRRSETLQYIIQPFKARNRTENKA